MSGLKWMLKSVDHFWKVSMTKWYTSDLHIGHKRICEFTDRKLVTTVEEHDEWVVDLWNSQVKPGDTVYIMGDFSFARFDKTCEALKKMQGQKHIIKGNHDRADDLDRLKAANLIQNWHDYKEIKVGGKEDNLTACLFHFPITAWHRQHYGSFMLHGHCHGSFQGEGKILDVGIDNSYNIFGEHKFFSEDDVLQFMQGREVYIAESHRNYKER